MPAGRPTKYKKKYCQEMLEYFKKAATKKVPKGEAPEMPTLQEFAVFHCDVDVATLREWKNRHPEFHAVYKKCKKIQEQMLIKYGLSNKYAQAMTCFLLKNWAGMADKIEQKNTHAIDKDLNFNIVQTDAKDD